MRHALARTANRIAAGIVLSALTFGCGSPTAPDPASVEYLVDVAGERFVLRVSSAAQVAHAEASLRGSSTRFPLGPLVRGDGGFNQPWSWHFEPAETSFVELAIEVCDGRPSYVETHLDDYPTYCPWGARVVSRRAR